MASETSSTLVFGLSKDSGDVEWFYETAEITTEQAMVIAHARGLHRVASAIENLANAVYALADKMPDPGDA